MASAAEQLASNINFGAFSKATELKKRIWFTLGALLVYRLGTYIPLPGINPDAFALAFGQAQQGVIGLFNMFSGGAVERMAIFALGIMPYISASIIIQLMTTVVPTLEQLKKEGEQGRKKINQYTRYGTVLLAVLQSYGIAAGLEGGTNIVSDPGWFFKLSTIISLTGGTMFLMWLGVLAIGTIMLIVFVERAQRRLLIQYPKRQMGNRMFQGDSSHLPLKLNTAGVIPTIFASSLLLLPTTMATFASGTGPEWLNVVAAWLGHGQPLYMLLFASMIVFFCFFYTAIVFNPADTADNLKRHGGFIPGIRPGERTATYIDYVLTRITVVGAIFLVVVSLLPEFLISATGVPFYLGGTSLLIVVSVTMDTVSQVQGHLLAHQYEGLVKKSKLRGGKRR